MFWIYGFLAIAGLDIFLELAVLFTGLRLLKLIQDRAHLILMYGVLVLLDCAMAHCDGKAWLDMRAETDKEVRDIWYRHINKEKKSDE